MCVHQDYTALSRSSLLGTAYNTWFDKCLTFSSFTNGWVANNIEHSALDAMVTTGRKVMHMYAEIAASIHDREYDCF